MQDLQLSATERTPEIKFSTSDKTLIISGESYPEDVSSFYGELIQISESLSSSDLDSLDVTVSLIYMNSSSVKAFYRIFEGSQLSPISQYTNDRANTYTLQNTE